MERSFHWEVESERRLPDADIVVFHRSDGSGTTHAWSDFLSKVSPAWKDTVGTGTTPEVACRNRGHRQ